MDHKDWYQPQLPEDTTAGKSERELLLHVQRYDKLLDTAKKHGLASGALNRGRSLIVGNVDRMRQMDKPLENRHPACDLGLG